MLAGRAELSALELGRNHRRGVGERGGGGQRLALGPVALMGAVRAVFLADAVALALGAVVEQQALLGLAPGADLGGQDAKVLEHVRVVDEPAREPAHQVVGH